MWRLGADVESKTSRYMVKSTGFKDEEELRWGLRRELDGDPSPLLASTAVFIVYPYSKIVFTIGADVNNQTLVYSQGTLIFLRLCD